MLFILLLSKKWLIAENVRICHLMEIRYLTKHGSIYIQRIEDGKEFWFKKDKGGEMFPLEEAVLVGYKRLQGLLREYRASLLDKTCYPDINIGREFLAEVKSEGFIGDRDDAETDRTTLCFLTKKADQYKLGCTSAVVRMESAA
jgi:hypothetical protein